MRLLGFVLATLLVVAGMSRVAAEPGPAEQHPLADLPEEDRVAYAEVSFVIVESTQAYRAANKVARRAASQLHLPLRLRGLKPHPKSGLTHTREHCADWGYPCYFARGRMDDGAYVSVERSDAYRGFKPGYFIVVVASARPGDTTTLADTLKRARSLYEDAYLKTTWVYQACMH